MRISDWSSDVCSSDLCANRRLSPLHPQQQGAGPMSTEAPIASAGAPGPAPRPYTKIDWKQAAALIAGGRTVEATADALGLAPERIWRHLNRSLRFRFYLRQAIQRQRLEAQPHPAPGEHGREAGRERGWTYG